MRHPVRIYVQALERLTSQATSRACLLQTLQVFLGVAARNNDLGAMRRVLEAFERKYRRREHVHAVEAEFANIQDRDMHLETLKKILASVLKRFTLQERIRPSLIRGVRLVVDGEQRIDASLEGAIRKF